MDVSSSHVDTVEPTLKVRRAGERGDEEDEEREDESEDSLSLSAYSNNHATN